MTALGGAEAGRRGSILHKPLSRREIGKGALATVSAVVGAAAGFGANEAVRAAGGSDATSGSSEARTAIVGEKLTPVEGSVFRADDSRYLERGIYPIHSQEDLEDALKMVRDTETLEPLDYKIDFDKQFAVVAAFGPSSYVSHEDKGGRRMGESIGVEVDVKRGRLMIQPTEQRLFLSHGANLEGKKPDVHSGSPVFLATYNRAVDEKGKELPIGIAKPKIKLFNSPSPFIS